MPMMRAINPHDESIVGEYEMLEATGLEQALQQAHETFGSWRTRDFAARAALMLRAAELLEERRETYARLMTREMGKTLASARSEVTKCAWVCRHYAQFAEVMLTPETVSTDAQLSMVRHDPLGAVLAIMPWNFPLWQVFRFAAPALMAGNVGLLKHAPNTPGCAVAIEEVFHDAGFPAGCLTNLFIGVEDVAGVIADRRVAAVTLTGSLRAGRAVGEQAGRAIKPSVLELGGSDPFIVLADADIEHALDGAIVSRTLNNGQSCIAAKRFIVHEDVHDAFLAGLVERMKALVQGDPMDEQTQMGPMARDDLRQELHEQAMRSVEAGATLECGGVLPQGPGFHYPPTVLSGVRPGMAAFDEETFGPLAAVVRVGEVEEAVALANQSEYGLGASVWTRDRRLALELVGRIQAGHVAVNGIVKSDPRLPFGGIKHSGYGRELARQGILSFVNAKTVWLG